MDFSKKIYAISSGRSRGVSSYVSQFVKYIGRVSSGKRASIFGNGFAASGSSQAHAATRIGGK